MKTKTISVRIDICKAEFLDKNKELKKKFTKELKKIASNLFDKLFPEAVNTSSKSVNTSSKSVNTPRFKPVAGYSDRFHKPLEELDGDQIVSDLFE